jgi:hypothetical protein
MQNFKHFWYVTQCSLVNVTNISERNAGSIFRAASRTDHSEIHCKFLILKNHYEVQMTFLLQLI